MLNSIINYFKTPSIPPAEKDSSDTQYIENQNPRNVYGLYISDFAELESDALKSWFEMKRKGLPIFITLLMNKIRSTDLHIGALYQRRKLSVLKKKWSINYHAKTKVPESQQNEILGYLNENFAMETFNVLKFIARILDAPTRGACGQQIKYQFLKNKWYVDNVRPIAHHLLMYNDIEHKYKFMDYKKCDITSLRALAATSSFDDRINVNDLAIPDPDPRKILLHESLDGDEENGFSNGFDDGIIWANFFKGYGCKDFATFVDRFANPAILGTYKTMMKREDRKKFWKTIMNFHNLMKAMLPETGTIDIKETMGKGVTAQLFKEYISLWDNYASTRILGESITSNQAEGGSQAKSRVGYQVSEDIIIADSMLVVAEVNRFIKRLLRLNFANLVEYPEFGYDEEVDIEYKVKRSTIFSNLNSIGYRPKQEDVEDEFDVAVDPVDSNPVPQAGANNFLRELFNETTGGIN